MSKTHTVHVRVYYEDTDAGGVVYHTNYLKFAERARTEWLRAKGFEQSDLLKEGIGFVVSHIEADFNVPARLDDSLTVETCLQEATKVRMKLRQIIRRGDKELVRLTVTIACVKGGKPARMPEGIV